MNRVDTVKVDACPRAHADKQGIRNALKVFVDAQAASFNVIHMLTNACQSSTKLATIVRRAQFRHNASSEARFVIKPMTNATATNNTAQLGTSACRKCGMKRSVRIVVNARLRAKFATKAGASVQSKHAIRKRLMLVFVSWLLLLFI